MYSMIDKTGGILINILIIGYLCQMCTSDMCTPNQCLNNGSCNPLSENEYSCTCERGWTGRNCQQNIDDCHPGLCKNGGTCIDQTDDRYLCRCTEKYVGNNCEFDNPCLKNRCLHGGICTPFGDGNWFCRCLKHFKGQFCEMRRTSCPDDLQRSRRMCGSHGTCQYNKDGALQCNCDSGYDGPYCHNKFANKISIGCVDGYCLNGGTCGSQENGDPVCYCAKNYRGHRCDVVDRNFNHTAQPSNMNPIKPEIATKMRNSNACNSECKQLRGNGICENQCNNDLCQYDGGDCDPWKRCKGQSVAHCRLVFRNKNCNPECNNVDCLFDGQDCDRSHCTNSELCTTVYQNGICNDDCNTPQCGFDGGDCQWKRSNSFFTNKGNVQKCSKKTKEFELDLVLLTTAVEFRMNQSTFLQTLGSILKIVLTISKVSETKFNSSPALSIKLKIIPSECVIYGGQCFSSLEQISDFLKAGLIESGNLQLPFRVAKVDSKTVYSFIPKKTRANLYFLLFVSIGSALIICLVVISVLLKDKWRRHKIKIKTTGIWTPSDGYSTSTSSLNSNHNSNRTVSLHPNNSKTGRCPYDNGTFKSDLFKHSELEKEFDDVPDVINRKRKYDIANSNGNALSFQYLSECIQSQNGINTVRPGLSKVWTSINENMEIKSENKYTNFEKSSSNIGEYVNESDESLLHIASRMNSGQNVIKRLYGLSPRMLHFTDKWGRTPLATAVASGSQESVEQLLTLEKQSRKTLKHHRGQNIQEYFQPFQFGDSSETMTTGLIEAVKLNSKDMIDMLFDEGSSVNVLDSMGRSVVHWAAMYGNVNFLEQLSHMKTFKKLINLKDHEEKTPLFLAANEGSVKTVNLITDYMIKRDIKIDPIYPCPLAVAKEHGFSEIVTLIQQVSLHMIQTENAHKRKKLKEIKSTKRWSTLSRCELQKLDSINEYYVNSTRSNQISSNEQDSDESYLFAMDSLEDYCINHSFDSTSNDLSDRSLLKPQWSNCRTYLSNSSSSEMSPPVLHLNHFSAANSSKSDSTLNRGLQSHTMKIVKPNINNDIPLDRYQPSLN